MSSSAVLSDRRILEERQDNHVIIEPFNESQLNNCSYNVTLSEFFFREKFPLIHENKKEIILFNPWIEQQVAQRWESGTVGIATDKDAKKLGLKVGDKYLVLAPFETILVATQEFIGGREHITAMIKGRSSAGRAFLSVCGGAGWGDIGYINRWALMITNLSRFSNVILPVGCSIAQIIFLESGHPRKSYDGKYQNELDTSKDMQAILADLKDKWSPAMMLPQLYKEFPQEEESSDEESGENEASFEVQKHIISSQV